MSANQIHIPAMPGFVVIQGEGMAQPQQQGVPQDYVDSLPARTIKEGETAECHICLEHMSDDEKNKPTCQLSCGHAFDKKCLAIWLKDHHNCPVCRHDLPIDPAANQQQPNMHQ
jgi:hypothetical protein